MNPNVESIIHIKLAAANVFLASDHFEKCIEVCNEVEEITRGTLANPSDSKPEMVLEQLAQIRRKLNSVMINRVRTKRKKHV